ncbi:MULTISPECIES: DUF305 domain-containing protein [Citromicrobium]|uniref:DUF305 domain-containing protein n=1 Tax=Citromicrobium TaxID=72173 RepID=UPI0001DD0C8F|nr:MULTISPECIES: DUF305 domain-containing protein [Citromicrobium]ALG59635.1 hypothetical protein WG74_01215 [Citromicrobium sp. JL477]KPM17257.1 hypothetical protein VO58_05200 [Citromicrobium sp. JL1351]KPM20194.1 hypothetical protein VM77_03995 [Citromicrobium sp. JL31]KPM29261.1 hypothetical protein VO57_04370 [Citromicrobium sp. JL2201]
MTIRTMATAASLIALATTMAVPLAAQDAPIIQPGAPGQENRSLKAEDASKLAGTNFAPADARFMQMMIPHHQQATEMTQLVDGRTSNPDIVKIAGRIDAGQGDEIAFMRDWLSSRGLPATMQHTAANMDGMTHAEHMAAMGMATPDQMKRLASLQGTAFDALFLELMIRHHQGAIRMVDDLLNQPGTAYDPVMFEFVNDIKVEQQGEIDRMNAVGAKLSTDPRAGLAPGFRDAGEAISNLRIVTAMPKPTGFFDPANPAQLQPRIEDDEEEAELVDATKADPRDEDEESEDRFGQRGSLLSFANTDMAFSGDLLVAGSYHGWNAYRLGEDGVPNLVTSVVCPGGQGDVSIVGDILIMSVQDSRARKDCGLQGVEGRVSEDRFRGLRIFDISDITNPRQVGLVQTCRGSHTHSVVAADDRRIVVYNSGTSYVRDDAELAGCFDTAGDETALFSIDVIEIPLADPAKSRIVDSPRVFAKDGQIAGLWRGGDHGMTEAGEPTQDTYVTNQCHDITVFPAKNIAAGACSGNGIILDISDPLKPVRIDDVTDKGFAYWHSATFNNDGTKVLFTDEWGGGGRPRCQAGDPRNWGADAIYSLKDGKLSFDSLYKLPAPQSDKENCVAHNGSIIPVPGRDIFVQAWYQGGISVIDFTDAQNPVEIAYFDRGPVDAEQLITGGYWSAYWYNGRIYATEIARGLDVFALEPSEFLTAEEIAAAEAAQYPGDVFNPQTQTQVTWPEDVLAAAEASRKGG